MANETVVCTYRVLADREPQFVQLLRRHWLTLHDLGFVTNKQPLVLRQVDEPPTSRSSPGSKGASIVPTSTRTCSPSGSRWIPCRGPRWSPEMGVPALPASAVRGVSTKAQGLRDLDDLELVFGALAHQSRRTILSVLFRRRGRWPRRDGSAVRLLVADYDPAPSHPRRGRSRAGRAPRPRADLPLGPRASSRCRRLVDQSVRPS